MSINIAKNGRAPTDAAVRSSELLEHQCPKGFISANEAAKILRVSLRTVRTWSNAKIIPSYKLGHFRYFKPGEEFQTFPGVKINGYRLVSPNDRAEPQATP